jgi:putative oxidoreductase
MNVLNASTSLLEQLRGVSPGFVPMSVIVLATLIAVAIIVAAIDFPPKREDKEIHMELGLFLLHAVPGLLLIGHGSQKLFGWLGGHGPEGTGQFMDSLGMRPGRRMALAAGFNEFAGGLLLALGLLIPLAAVLIASTMLVAALTAHRGKGLWATNNGYELPLLYGLIPVALTFHGAGQWSLDHALGWGAELSGLGWGLGVLAVAALGAMTIVAGARHAAHDHGLPTTG